MENKIQALTAKILDRAEQEIKDEKEQAVKRGGEVYADGYIEGLLDGMNKILSKIDTRFLSPCVDANKITDIEYNNVIKLIYKYPKKRKFNKK